MSGALRDMPWGIDTANHAGIRIRGYTAEQVAPLLAKSAAYDALVAGIDLNDNVMVKLNAHGLAILKAQHDELRAAVPSVGEWNSPKTDAEGFSKHQLWCLFQDFGPSISLPARKPFDSLASSPTPTQRARLAGENRMDNLVQRAKDLAHRAHAGQVDKAGRPYIEHVARVAAACADDPEAEAVAWLHDVLEDTSTCLLDLEIAFPPIVARAALILTRFGWVPDDAYYRHITTNPLALRVKLADIADNADEARLALLDAKTSARLRRKYAKAIAALTGAAGGG